MAIRRWPRLLAWAVVLGLVGLGHARAIPLVTNPDFAADPNYVQPAGYQWPFNNAANWTAFDNGRAPSGTYGPLWDNAPTLPDGASTVGFIQSITQDAFGNSYPSGLSGIMQTINGLASGSAYTISFYQNARLASSTPQQNMPYLSVTMGGATLSSNMAIATGAWVHETLSFTAASSSEILQFITSQPQGGDATALISDAQIIPLSGNTSTTLPVSKPLSMALLGTGLIGIGVGRNLYYSNRNSATIALKQPDI